MAPITCIGCGHNLLFAGTTDGMLYMWMEPFNMQKLRSICNKQNDIHPSKPRVPPPSSSSRPSPSSSLNPSSSSSSLPSSSFSSSHFVPESPSRTKKEKIFSAPSPDRLFLFLSFIFLPSLLLVLLSILFSLSLVHYLFPSFLPSCPLPLPFLPSLLSITSSLPTFPLVHYLFPSYLPSYPLPK